MASSPVTCGASSMDLDEGDLDDLGDLGAMSCDHLCNALTRAIHAMAASVFLGSSGGGASRGGVLGIESSVMNYNIMYHLLFHHDERFDTIRATLEQAIHSCVQDSFAEHCGPHEGGALSPVREVGEFVQRCKYWCKALQSSFDPYCQFLELYHYNERHNRGGGAPTYTLEGMFTHVVSDLLCTHWSAIASQLKHRVEQYRHDMSATASQVCDPEAQQLYLTRMLAASKCANTAMSAQAAGEAQAALLGDPASAHPSVAPSPPVYHSAVPSQLAAQIPQLLGIFREYMPLQVTQFVAAVEDADVSTIDGVAHHHPSLHDFCRDSLNRYYVEWRVLYTLHTSAELHSAGNAAKHTYNAKILQGLRKSCSATLRRALFDDLYRACRCGDLDALTGCIEHRNIMRRCMDLTARRRRDELLDERHFQQALRSRTLAIGNAAFADDDDAAAAVADAVADAEVDADADADVDAEVAAVDDAYTAAAAKVDAADDAAANADASAAAAAAADADSIIIQFTYTISSMLTLAKLSDAELSDRALYCFDQPWFRDWCRRLYLKIDRKSSDWSLFTESFDEYFFVIWLSDIMRKPLSFVEYHAIGFFKLFSALPSKDIFIEIYMKVVRSRFLHDRFHSEIDCMIHLHLESVVGQHPLLHQYQHMISEQHFPPMCWQGMRGKVLARANWKNMPYHSCTLHPRLQESVSGYVYAYAFNYPDRELEWVLFYGMCQLCVHTAGGEEGGGGEGTMVVCSMLIGNALLHIVDHDAGVEEGQAENALCDAGFGALEARFWCEHLMSCGVLQGTPNGGFCLCSALPQNVTVPTPSFRRYESMLARQQRGETGKRGDAAAEKCVPPDATEYQVLADRSHAVRARLVHVLKHADNHLIREDALFQAVRSQIHLFVLTREVFDKQLTRIVELEYARRCDESGSALVAEAAPTSTESECAINVDGGGGGGGGGGAAAMEEDGGVHWIQYIP